MHAMLQSKVRGEANLLVLSPSEEASEVGPDISNIDGVCYVQVPNRPADAAIWEVPVKGSALR